MNCPKCLTECQPEWKSCPKCGFELLSDFAQKREYKAVDFQTNGIFSSFKAMDVQNVLNNEAKDGWIFDRYIANEYFDKHNLIIFVFYRELD